MGRNSQQRRARKHREEQQQKVRSAPSSGRGGRTTTADLIELACESAYGPMADKAMLAMAMTHIHRLHNSPDPPDRLAPEIERRLRQMLDLVFEDGWQPADVVHAVKRQFTVRAAKLARALIADHSRRFDAPTRAPHPWLAQLSDLGTYRPTQRQIIGGHGDVLATWARAENLHPEDMLDGAIQVLALLRRATRQTLLIDPPSKWGATNIGTDRPTATTSGEVDAKALKVIRALLAKAEATSFEAEAEAFTTKAQELMTRHSIDAAVLAAAAAGSNTRRGVEARRVHIDNPYADEKVHLLGGIADVNGARCVWVSQPGFATIVGFPVDLQLTDLLFTSLLVQATHASAEATRHDARLRNASFRRAFLIAFADRVAERLRATRQHVTHKAEREYGSSLVPILAEREAAVDATYEDMFPGATPMRARRLNSAGWYAGTAAADKADIGVGEAITSG